jgi:hypothetical protein
VLCTVSACVVQFLRLRCFVSSRFLLGKKGVLLMPNFFKSLKRACFNAQYWPCYRTVLPIVDKVVVVPYSLL